MPVVWVEVSKMPLVSTLMNEAHPRLRKTVRSSPAMLVSRICRALEFTIRYMLVNLPTFTMASFPAIDRVCSVVMTYLLLQVVGICWAILLNAAFALACRVTNILPEISWEQDPAEKIPIEADLKYFSGSTSIQLLFSFYVAYASIRVVVSFAQNIFKFAIESTRDFPEASASAVLGGIKTLYISRLAFFPVMTLLVALLSADTLCLDVNEGGESTSRAREALCNSGNDTNNICSVGNLGNEDGNDISGVEWQGQWRAISLPFRGKMCTHTGFSYLTSPHDHLRSILSSVLLIMLLQIWQAYLQQFPNWAKVFHNMPGMDRVLFQTTATLLMTATLGTLSALFSGYIGGYFGEQIVCSIMLGWTLWLYLFVPWLAIRRGDYWTQTATTRHIQHMIAYIRLSQMLILIAFFCYLSFKWGLLQAQLDLTFITILLPTMYSTVYLIGYRVLQVQSSDKASLFVLGASGSLVGSVFCTVYLAKTDASGSVILVFVHMMSKWLEFYDTSLSTTSSDYELVGEYSEDTSHFGNPESALISQKGEGTTTAVLSVSALHTETEKREDTASISIDSGLDLNLASGVKNAYSTPPPSSPARPRSNSALLKSHSYGYLGDASLDIGASPGNSGATDGYAGMERRVNSYGNFMDMSADTGRIRTNSITTQYLEGRGRHDNPLVSLGIPNHVKKHWLVRLPKRNMRFIGNIARSWTQTDNIYSGTIRAFVSLGVILTLLLLTVTIAAYAQKSLAVFPKLIDFELYPAKDESGTETKLAVFDHRVANVSLLLAPDALKANAWYSSPSTSSTAVPTMSLGFADTGQYYKANTEKPHYIACSWRWRGLSVLDFALLSQVAYFDAADGQAQIQHIVDTLFPNDDFVASSTHIQRDKATAGPRFVEISSKSKQITVLAVRGTDLGRLQDIMEDFKLFAEPVIFALLSTAFPTIRMWNHETTARIIEGLYEFNSFFGLQGEPEYYRPLAQRVLDISDEYSASGDAAPDPNIVITGHSLGGGLARIVGTLTGQPSVSFGPPGLGLSYRKYSFDASYKDTDSGKQRKRTIRVDDKGQLDHQSLAIVTEFDVFQNVDYQVGMVQNIQCDHKNNTLHSSACHLLEGTICHLLRHCGDSQERFVSCHSSFEFGRIPSSLGTLFWNYRYISAPFLLLIIAFILLAIVPELV